MTRAQLVKRSLQVLPVAVLCVWASLPAAEATRPVDQAAGLIRYEAPGGGAWFALSLRASGISATTAPHDHVIVVDTSASQAGGHRDQALAVLDGCLASLQPQDRVSLYAVDVKVQPLSNGFVGAASAELRTAVAKLKKRVPLGSTDLLPALQTAAKVIDGKHPASILYFGDGMSIGRLIEADEMKSLVTELRTREIPVHSFAVGPRTDLQVMGLLASHTGGVVIVDDLVNDKARTPADLGRQLAAATLVPVIYPTRIATNPELPELLPTLPPLRSDRETVLLGQGMLAETVTVRVTAKSQGKELSEMSWTLKPTEASVANTFLANLWSTAERDRGLSFPLAGHELLNFARQNHEDSVMSLVTAGNKAVAARNLKLAREIAWQIRQIDPENVQSQAILNAAQRIDHRQVALQDPPAVVQPEEKPAEEKPAVTEERPAEEKPAVTEEKPAEAPADPAAPADAAAQPVEAPAVTAPEVPSDEASPLEVPTVDERKAAEIEAQLRALRAQQRQQDVRQAIESADRTKIDTPDETINNLKQLKSSIDSDSGIDANVREELSRRVREKILEVQSAKIKIEQDKQELQRREAQRQAERRTLDLVQEREDKLERRIEQVRALMTRGFAGEEAAFPEALSVAQLAFQLDPYSGITNAAVFDSQAAMQLDKAHRIRARRVDKFLAALEQSEQAHIPFPDEPPVLYPPAEVWQFITQKRKKWESVDLVRNNPIEEKIRRTLYAATTVNFDQNPFEDCIKFISDQHGINIVIDKKTLEDEGIDTSTPVTLKLEGISLRSVLKLLLEPLQLTYIIEDEVMKITTATTAGNILSTRVFYVGDLVIPIFTPQAGGIGQGLGGVGGFGGSQGSFGGGQFGVGGGGQGGNGFGGQQGGGLFNVLDDEVPFNNDAIQRKKKLER